MNGSHLFDFFFNASEVGELCLIAFERRVCVGELLISSIFVELPKPIVL
jgi:hypothetical protein